MFAGGGDQQEVRHARRQLAELGQDHPAQGIRVRHAARPRDLDVAGPGPAEGQREVGPGVAGPVGLVRELDAAIGEQEVGGTQLGPDVQERLVVPAVRSFLRILSRWASANARKRADPASQASSSRANASS